MNIYKSRTATYAFLFAVIGLPFGGGLALNAHHLNSCNAGSVEACSNVHIDALKSQIKNADYLAQVEAKAEVDKKAKAERQAKVEADSKAFWDQKKKEMLVGDMTAKCARMTKDQLKDPDSYREISRGVSSMADGKATAWVRYSATNSFGGRVQETNSCSFTYSL